MCLAERHAQKSVSEMLPSSAQEQLSASMCPLFDTENERWEKTKQKMCLCATVQRCSASAQPPISLSWTCLLTEMAEGHFWHIPRSVQPSLLTSQSESSLYGRSCDGSTQKGAQHREQA